jgi:N-acetylneuraminate synthase
MSTAPKVLTIAEAGVNHNGERDLAFRLVDEAKAAGADVVKFQSFKTERLVSKRAQKADYQKQTTGGDESQHGMLKRLELDAKTLGELNVHARKAGIELMSTPFDVESLAMLVDLGVKRIKLGSGDITNAPLLRAAARTGLPLILSSGMSTLGDIEAALAEVAASILESKSGGGTKISRLDALASEEGQRALEERVTLLHCTTEYPAPLAETNLRAIETLRSAFGITTGYSDHTEGIAVSIAAIALGARVIEKHFTLDRNMPGPDHKASLEPAQLRDLVAGIRAVELALGRSLKRPGTRERANMPIARRSIVAAVPITKGQTITADMLDAKRPAGGISPMRIDEIVGRIATRDYQPDDPIEL